MYILPSVFPCFFKKEKKGCIEVRQKDKLARIELDLTQTELPHKITAQHKSISRYETGASLPSIRTLVKIARVLKKPAGYFLDE